jgi:paraquat-inducible protein A
MEHAELIACPECDLLQHKPAMQPCSIARCPRCGTVLMRRVASRLDAVLAITLGGLITFLIAQAAPLVSLEANGISNSVTLPGAIAALWADDMQVVAAIVFCTTTLFPLVEFAALLYVLLPLRAGYRPYGFDATLRAIQFVRPWGMIEVFMLGVLVALVKLSSLAEVTAHAALFAFGALTPIAALVVSLDPRALWDIAERLPERTPTPPGHARRTRQRGEGGAPPSPTTATATRPRGCHDRP